MVEFAPFTTITLAEIQEHAARLGRIAFLASTRADGRPHSVPVGVAWVDDAVCAFVSQPSVKVSNLRRDPRAHLHWAVSAETNNDSLIVEGRAQVIDTTEERTALWDRMGYDLSQFEPGGPSSDGHVFLRIVPEQASLLAMFGFERRSRWTAAAA